MSAVTQADKPFWAKCAACSHCWPAAWFPMEAALFADIAKSARCPKCGSRQVVVARQDDGTLLEDTALDAGPPSPAS